MEASYDYEKVENSATVSSSIMMKLPTDNLGPLRARFQESAEGLPLPDFLEAVVKNMELTGESDVLAVTADLIDFFHLVDINGDGFMEWEEFVMFILDAVVKEEEAAICEKVVPHGIRQIQPAAVRNPVKSAHFIPALNKLLVGVGQSIQIYTVDDKSPQLTALVYVVHLEGADKLEAALLPGEKPFTVFDLAFCTEHSILCVLRSDLKFEFIRFMSLANYSKETIQHLGVVAVEQSYSKICFRNKINDDVPSRLMAIGTNEIIDTWVLYHSEDDQIRITEHFMMKKHTDYVRDLLVIHTDCLRFIASASMDKKVMLWDLYTMQYKSVRTGHTAGVECLAFDGKSLLLAGGYDYTIIAWDLDAEINRPLFVLRGHESAVIHMVAMHNIERCVTLDDAGVIRWWDICKAHASESRLIDTATTDEDHARTISVFRNLGYSFDTLHGCLVVANGRRQHTFKFKNVGRVESPPIAVVFSKKLLTIYTIHQRDIIFWSAVTGEQQKYLSGVVGPNTRLMCATLDNRERRLFTGDSTGIIAVYNCLNGMFLKKFQFLNSPIRELIFSRDKNIIVLTYASDIYVMDDSCDDPHEDPDSILRELKCTPDIAEIVLLAYSYRLGLIAAIDIMGRLVLLDYQYMTIELIVDNVTKAHSTVQDMQFLEHYPLLVLVDSDKNFTIVTLKTRMNTSKERFLRVETVAPMPSKEEMAEEQSEETEEADDDEVIGTKATPYNKRRLHRFKGLSKDVRHMTLLQQDAAEHIASHDDESTATNALTTDSSKQQTDSDEIQQEKSSNITISAVLGFEDGEISVIDLTTAIEAAGIMRLGPKDCVQHSIDYNSKAKCIRSWSTSLAKLLDPEEVTRREVHSSTPLSLVFRPHSHEVTALHIIGDFDAILTASNDCSVQMWSLEGRILGILTRGGVLDNLFRKHWQNPIDMRLRSDIRMSFAREMVEKLFLRTIVNRRISCNVVKTSSYLDFQQQNHRMPSPVPQSSHTASSSSLPSDMIIAAPITFDDMTKTLRKIKKLPDRERVMFQLQGQITYEPSKKEVTQIMLQTNKMQSKPVLPKPVVKKKRRKGRKSELFNEGATKDEHHKYLQTIKMADEYLNKDNAAATASTNSLRKWQYELEMSEIEAQDPTNWEITSNNRKKSMYAHWVAELTKGGVMQNKQAVMEAKLNAFSPNKNFASFSRFMHGPTSKSTRLKRATSLAQSLEHKPNVEESPVLSSARQLVSSTPDVAVKTDLSLDYYTFEDGNVIAKHTNITNSYPTFDSVETFRSDADDAQDSSRHIATASPTILAFRERTPPTTLLPPLLPLNNPAKQLSQSQNQKRMKPEATAAENNRIETRKLVEKFERDLAVADKIDKRSRKKNKLRKRVRPTHYLQRDDSHRSYSCAQKMIAKQSSFEGMLAVGRKQLMAEMNWVRKVKQMTAENETEIATKSTENANVSSLKERTKMSALGRQASFTLFGIVKDEMAHKQQEEQRILARQSFGPYKATELSELYMIFQSLPKRVPSDDDKHQYSGINMSYNEDGEEIAYIYVTDLYNHPFVLERQYYREQLEKQAKKSIDRSMGPYYTISSVLAILCPLMTSTDRKDCMKFFSLHAKNEDMGEVVDLTDHKVERLKLMFEFFDVDQSGTVDKTEIVQAMNRHMNVGRRRFSNAMLKGVDHVAEGNVTEEYITNMIKGADVDKNDQLDFTEFSSLFGNMVD